MALEYDIIPICSNMILFQYDYDIIMKMVTGFYAPQRVDGWKIYIIEVIFNPTCTLYADVNDFGDDMIYTGRNVIICTKLRAGQQNYSLSCRECLSDLHWAVDLTHFTRITCTTVYDRAF